MKLMKTLFAVLLSVDAFCVTACAEAQTRDEYAAEREQLREQLKAIQEELRRSREEVLRSREKRGEAVSLPTIEVALETNALPQDAIVATNMALNPLTRQGQYAIQRVADKTLVEKLSQGGKYAVYMNDGESLGLVNGKWAAGDSTGFIDIDQNAGDIARIYASDGRLLAVDCTIDAQRKVIRTNLEEAALAKLGLSREEAQAQVRRLLRPKEKPGVRPSSGIASLRARRAQQAAREMEQKKKQRALTKLLERIDSYERWRSLSDKYHKCHREWLDDNWFYERKALDAQGVSEDDHRLAHAYVKVTSQVAHAEMEVAKYRLPDSRVATLKADEADYYRAQMSNRVATVTACKADLAELEPYLTPAVINTVMRMIAYRSEYQAKKEKENALKERMDTIQEDELRKLHRQDEKR